jgi:hypothetical protein
MKFASQSTVQCTVAKRLTLKSAENSNRKASTTWFVRFSGFSPASSEGALYSVHYKSPLGTLLHIFTSLQSLFTKKWVSYVTLRTPYKVLWAKETILLLLSLKLTTTNDNHLIKGVFFNTYSCFLSSLCARVRPHFRFGSEIWNWSENFVSLGSEKKASFHMFHFDAKHQKSDAKTKVKWAKIKWKNWSETKIKRKIVKKSEKKRKKVKRAKKRKNILEFRYALFRFEAKITKSKRSKKFKAKKNEKSKKMQKIAKKCFFKTITFYY